jgi:hypothetical protein
MKDLVVLVADRQQEKTLQALLRHRCPALGITPPTFQIYPHPGSDPGVYGEAGDFLRPYSTQYRHALVMLDREWDGAPEPAELVNKLKNDLANADWSAERTEVILPDPELEIWFWIENSPHIEALLKMTWPEIRQVAQKNNWWPDGSAKPARPKELLETLTVRQKIPRSASLYVEMAEKASLRRCQDFSFQLLVTTLQAWFPTE